MTRILAQQGNLAPDDAFTVLRSYARNHGLRLSGLCRDIIPPDRPDHILRPAF